MLSIGPTGAPADFYIKAKNNMPSTSKMGLSIVLLFTLFAFSLHLDACAEEYHENDALQYLPGAIRRLVPATMGAEAIAEHTIKKNTKLIAAILAPKWHLAGLESPNHEYGYRTLVVWRSTRSGWVEIGRNTDIVYMVETAGLANISIFWDEDKLHLEQYSEPPPRAYFNDDYIFSYDAATNKLLLTNRKSSSIYRTMCCMGANDSMIADYEAAQKMYGDDACDYQGYLGEIDYLLGSASITQCEFAKNKVSRLLQMSTKPISLNFIKHTPYDKLAEFSK